MSDVGAFLPANLKAAIDQMEYKAAESFIMQALEAAVEKLPPEQAEAINRMVKTLTDGINRMGRATALYLLFAISQNEDVMAAMLPEGETP